MAKIKITQIRSGIDRPLKQKKTLIALGIRKVNHSVEHEETPQIAGMIRAISHLLKVEKV